MKKGVFSKLTYFDADIIFSASYASFLSLLSFVDIQSFLS